jgi:hypothetical protein
VRYNKALERFFRWLRTEQRLLPDTPECADEYLGEFIESCWEGGDSKGCATDVLSSAQWRCPQLRGQLRTGWSLVKAWQLHELPSRAPPLPAIMFFSLANVFSELQRPHLAAAILLGGHCMLRTGELLSASWSSLALDVQATPASGVLSLGFTKGGSRHGVAESVTIELPWLVYFLEVVRQIVSPAAADTLCQVPPHQFRSLFKEAVDILDCGSWGFQPYSIRRGAATELWRRTGQLSLVTLRGRWMHPTTIRVYVNEGLAVLAEMRLPREDLAMCAARAQRTIASAVRKVFPTAPFPTALV